MKNAVKAIPLTAFSLFCPDYSESAHCAFYQTGVTHYQNLSNAIRVAQPVRAFSFRRVSRLHPLGEPLPLGARLKGRKINSTLSRFRRVSGGVFDVGFCWLFTADGIAKRVPLIPSPIGTSSPCRFSHSSSLSDVRHLLGAFRLPTATPIPSIHKNRGTTGTTGICK